MPPATTAPAEIHTVQLSQPIVRASGEPIDKLEVRRPKAGELRGLKVDELFNADINALFVLLPRITSPVLVQDHLEQLELCDLMELAGIVRGFFMTPEMKAMVAKVLGAETSSTS